MKKTQIKSPQDIFPYDESLEEMALENAQYVVGVIEQNAESLTNNRRCAFDVESLPHSSDAVVSCTCALLNNAGWQASVRRKNVSACVRDPYWKSYLVVTF